MGRAASVRAKRGKQQRRFKTEPTTGQMVRTPRPPQTEEEYRDTLIGRLTKRFGSRPVFEPVVSSDRRARRKAAQLAERRAARERAYANGKRRGR